MSLAAIDFKSIIELGTLTTVIGMGITFIMLFVLVLIISLTSKLNILTRRTSKVKVESTNNVESLIENELNENSLELIAVISAVYAMLEQEQLPKANFVVRSIKKISSGGQ